MNSTASTRSHTFPHFDWSRTLSMNENRQMDMEEHELVMELMDVKPIDKWKYGAVATNLDCSFMSMAINQM